ncbi:hypothetical protein CapIbe_015786 [Capra ibex]
MPRPRVGSLDPPIPHAGAHGGIPSPRPWPGCPAPSGHSLQGRASCQLEQWCGRHRLSSTHPAPYSRLPSAGGTCWFQLVHTGA